MTTACKGHVHECTACEWRTGNRVGQPCVKCEAEVIERACRKAPIRGGPVCVDHGGSAPQVRAAANRRLAELEAAKVLAEVEVTPIGDPLQALLDLAAEVFAKQQRLDAIVATLEQLRADPSRWGTEQIDARIQLLERYTDRLHRILETIARLGIDERRLAIEHMQLDLDAAVILGTLRALGLDTDSERVQTALEATFIAIENGAKP